MGGGGPRRTPLGAPGAPSAARSGRDEDGFTLTELLVAMTCFVIVTTIVAAALVSAYGSESRVAASSQASSQITQAFMRLDTEVRYSSDINQPGQSAAGNYYVELQSDWTAGTSASSATCTQLEYDNTAGTLLQRSWPAGSSAPAGWQTLASGLATGLSQNPFSLSVGQGTPWQLTVSLRATSGVATSAQTAQSSFTITSLDTNSSSLSQGVCGGTPA